jgi:hypothetical protein
LAIARSRSGLPGSAETLASGRHFAGLVTAFGLSAGSTGGVES